MHTGDALPWKLLTNSTYEDGLGVLAEFEEFGGSRRLEPAPDCVRTCAS